MKALFFIAFFFIFGAPTSSGQSVSVTGNAGVSSDYYDFSSSDSTLRPRRPEFNYRVSISPTISIGKKIKLPFTFLYTKKNPSAILPLSPDNFSLKSLSDPNNNIGFHPKFDWVTIHLGTHTADFSTLTSGNIAIFGAGIDLTPKKFRLAYSDGFVTWAIRPDTMLNLEGTYRRRLQAIKIGYGKSERSGFFLNAVKTKDELGSLKNEPGLKTIPQEGIVFSTDFRIFFSKKVVFSGEIGASGFSKNQNDQEITDNPYTVLPTSLFTFRQSSRADLAGLAALKFNFKTWGVTLQSRYFGAGFVPAGYNFVETDLLEYTIEPRLQMFNNKLLLNGTLGLRKDNLSQTKIATTNRFIGNMSVVIIPSKQFSIASNYSNYGMRNDIQNDTLRIEFISQNFSVTPMFKFKTSETEHTITLTYNAAVFEDKNLLTGVLGSNNVKTFSGNYSVGIGKLSFGLMAFRTQNKRLNYEQIINTASFRVGLAILKKALNISTSVVYSSVAQTAQSVDSRLLFRPQVRWKLPKQTSINLTGSFQAYQYGSVRNNASYKETLLQVAVNKGF